MGCRFAGQCSDLDGVDPAGTWSTESREPILHVGDALFATPGTPALPATLTGGRCARHMLVWEGYFLAADLLVESVEREPRQALRLVYPVLFAYRHAVEVGLKFIIDFYGDANAPRGHCLRDLWTEARGIIERHCQPLDEELLAFDGVIAELDAVDRQSTAFRYTWPRRPITEEEYDAVDSPLDREDVDLDLAVVRSTMRRVQEFLDEMDFQLMNCGFDRRD